MYDSIVGVRKFALGMVNYADRFGDDHHNRIVVPVVFGGQIRTSAVVDTGAPWCILNPEEAAALGIESRADCVDIDRPLIVRGDRIRGRLCVIPISFEAQQGEDMTLDASVFIPSLAEGQLWPYPNFLGLDGLLSRLRFAVDPETNAFYFGLLGTT